MKRYFLHTSLTRNHYNSLQRLASDKDSSVLPDWKVTNKIKCCEYGPCIIRLVYSLFFACDDNSYLNGFWPPYKLECLFLSGLSVLV